MKTELAQIPRNLQLAGLAVAAQGVTGVVVGIFFVARAIAGKDPLAKALGASSWFVFIGALVCAGGCALFFGRRWGRGIAVVSQLLLLPVVYYLFVEHHPIFGSLLALWVVVALGCLLSPSATVYLNSAPGFLDEVNVPEAEISSLTSEGKDKI